MASYLWGVKGKADKASQTLDPTHGHFSGDWLVTLLLPGGTNFSKKSKAMTVPWQGKEVG
jgi:hypothetical protein